MRRIWFVWLGIWGVVLVGVAGWAGQMGGSTAVSIAQAAPSAAFLTAGQTYTSATVIPMAYPSLLVFGDQTNTTTFTSDVTDPPLSCLASSPFSPKGYRSAWYRLTPPAGGLLVIETLPNSDYRSNYDTAVAVYVGNINSLSELACNDDHIAFFSRTTLNVSQSQTYYIEVVARDFSAGSRPPTLNFRAELFASEDWETAGNLPEPITGHTVVVSGTDAYIVGGFSSINPVMGTGGDRSGWFHRYNTLTGELSTLPSMPAAPAPGGSGYGYADGAISRNLFHLPNGFVGTNGVYDGTHWVYDFETNQWRVFSAANGQVDPPWGASPGTNVPGWTTVLNHEFGLQRGIYVVGGLRGTFRGGPNALPSANAYLMLDTGSGYSWLNLPNMNTARYAHTAARFGRDVCVVGGLTVIDNGDALLSGGECYKPTGIAPDFVPGWYPTVGNLNIPRFMADSAVGADGRWYVFGGINASGNYIPQVEVHDFSTGTWSIVNGNLWLDAPALAWPRGEFIGNTLWVFGGQQQGGPAPIPLIQQLDFPIPASALPLKAYLPLISYGGGAGQSLTSAIPIQSGQGIYRTFQTGKAYDIYTFFLPNTRVAHMSLSQIPGGYDYDLLLYGSNKTLIDFSVTPGTNEELIVRSLPAGQYYLFVANTSPTIPQSAQPYWLQFGLECCEP
ncbi:MAG: hypothetical protein OT477_18320 [Chloroflexi bacterium]|nr:hypothetical protein [Chloroflexota bacterium]